MAKTGVCVQLPTASSASLSGFSASTIFDRRADGGGVQIFECSFATVKRQQQTRNRSAILNE
jgi:hypothetical protein